MNKTGLALRMLAILTSGKLYKISELAKKLEVTERKVLELRDELEIADFRIEGIRGPNGGYRLDMTRSRLLSILNITNQELTSLKFIKKTIRNNNTHYHNFTNVVNKIESLSKLNNVYDFEIIKPINYNRLSKKESENFQLIKDAIKSNNKVKFKYKTLKSQHKEFVIEPYELYYYKGFWYLITFYEKYLKAYHYKLVRMNNLEILSDKYQKSTQYKLCNFTGETSIFKGEEFYLELIIKPPSSIFISELCIAKDQEIIENEDNSILFKGSMEGKVEIISWLLSLGNDVTIISPKEINDEYLLKIKEMYNNIIS